jgi:hypothetical protein
MWGRGLGWFRLEIAIHGFWFEQTQASCGTITFLNFCDFSPFPRQSAQKVGGRKNALLLT